jgi:ATP-binding cassette subfamily B (MDR/TAP) protein 1
MIERFYDPNEGTIEFDGVDMRDINVHWLRDQLGLVCQEASLFATTIEENIRYGFPEATERQIIEAAKQANCHDFIMAFPDGYQTRIGESSSALVSGGEKQRIALARALLKKPRILLLDEATSALDSANERIVQVALDAIMTRSEQTCVVIAHRLSTIRNADRIAVIDNGVVQEIGSHDELMAMPNGQYHRLQELQDLTASSKRGESKVPKHSKLLTEMVELEEENESADRREKLSSGPETPKEVSRYASRIWKMGYDDRQYLFVGKTVADGLQKLEKSSFPYVHLLFLLYDTLRCRSYRSFVGWYDVSSLGIYVR